MNVINKYNRFLPFYLFVELVCNMVPDAQYDDFMMVLKSNCKLQDKIDSKIYKQQLLYKCAS